MAAKRTKPASSSNKKAAPAKKVAPKKSAPKKAAPKVAPKKAAKPAPARKPTPKPAPKKAAPKAAPKQAAAKAAPKAPPSQARVPAAKPSEAKPSEAKATPRSAAPARPSSPGKTTPPARPSVANAPAPARAAKVPMAARTHTGETVTLVRSEPRAPAPSGRGAAMSPAIQARRGSERPPASSPPLPLPVRRIAEPLPVEERYALIVKRLAAQPEEFQRRYQESFDMSWIYHDSALEGVVYTLEELRGGLSPEPLVTDSSLQPAVDEIRRHREAIEYVRDFAQKSRQPITMDVIKKIYLILHPSEGDLKTVKYRKDIPQHRLYFHEYAAPDKIAYKVRQVVDWLNEPETKKTRNALRIAARAHYDLLRVFPFQNDSGKVSRLLMNLILLRGGYPAAIIHSTERQRYYDALKGSANVVLSMAQEAVENSLASVEKLLDEHEQRARPFGT